MTESLSKKILKDGRIMVAGVDVSDHVSAIDTHHKVGDLITAVVEFQGVRIEEEDGPSGKRQVFHLVERETD